MSRAPRLFARVLSRLGVSRRYRDKMRRGWQENWSDPTRVRPWMNRGISPEIVEAANGGWFPAGGSALDIGCGEGEVAAWMAEQGFPAVGVDIAPAAVARAQARFNGASGQLEFFAADVCNDPLPDRQYRILIDRGCFHNIQPNDYADFLGNLLRVSAPDARLLLLCKAFRHGIPQGDLGDRRRVSTMVEEGFDRGFRIMRSADTYLDPFGGRDPDKAMGGMAFWMERR